MRKVFILVISIISVFQVGCHQNKQPVNNVVKAENKNDEREGASDSIPQKTDGTSSLRENREDSVYISYYPSGAVYLKKIYYKNGNKDILAFNEDGQKKSELNFLNNGKVHFRKFNLEGNVMTEVIEEDGKKILDTIYWDNMFDEEGDSVRSHK